MSFVTLMYLLCLNFYNLILIYCIICKALLNVYICMKRVLYKFSIITIIIIIIIIINPLKASKSHDLDGC